MPMRILRHYFITLFFLFLIALVPIPNLKTNQQISFDGHRAYRHVLAQVGFGPRTPGSTSHMLAVNYIISELTRVQWQVSTQFTEYKGFKLENIFASRGFEIDSPCIILGTHYDSRLYADQDIDPWSPFAVPGANDGASGVSVLLELARSLPLNTVPIWLVFFDAEDNGGIDKRNWIMGSTAFVDEFRSSSPLVVIVDMVGDSDLDIYIEMNSDPDLVEDIWNQAARLGFAQFHPEPKYSIIDDHIPFLDVGIRAIDIIDFDYPFWHTHMDTVDKIHPESLRIVGETLRKWIMSYNYR